MGWNAIWRSSGVGWRDWFGIRSFPFQCGPSHRATQNEERTKSASQSGGYYGSRYACRNNDTVAGKYNKAVRLALRDPISQASEPACPLLLELVHDSWSDRPDEHGKESHKEPSMVQPPRCALKPKRVRLGVRARNGTGAEIFSITSRT
jgi:hypothetical protein